MKSSAAILILAFGFYICLYLSRTTPVSVAGHVGTRAWPAFLISTQSRFESVAFRPLMRTEDLINRYLHLRRMGRPFVVAGMTGTPQAPPTPAARP